MGLKKNNPGCKCCETGDEGSPCEYCSGTTPLTLSLTVSGIEDDTCDECETTLNGTFGLMQGDSACTWRSADINVCTDQYFYEVTIDGFNGRLDARLWQKGPLTDVVVLLYRKAIGATIDCEASHTLSYVSENTWTQCDMNASQPDWTLN